MDKEIRFIFDIVRYVLGCSECPKYDENIDFFKLHSLCKNHNICAIVAYGLNKTSYKSSIPKEVLNKFMNSWKLSMALDVAQQGALDELSTLFNENKIKFMPLKGIYMKKLYPSTELRQMSDLDILFSLEQEDAVDSIMKKLGYDVEYDAEHHNIYKKLPFLTVEMHHNLVDAGSRFDDYYKDIFLRVNNDDYFYRMNWNDYYIFHMVHFIKHFTNAGCGIRFLFDQFVLQSKLKNKLDTCYIDKELKKLGIYEFEQNMSQLSIKIFEGCSLTGFEEKVLEYMLDSGVYGNEICSRVNRLSLFEENVGISKMQNWVKTIFLPLKIMRKDFPYVDKYPFLLPIGWVHRWIRMILFKRKRIKEVYRLNTVDDDKLMSRREFLNKVGVNEKYL